MEEIVEDRKQFKQFETAEETTNYMMKTFNTKLDFQIATNEIDIAHILKKGPEGKNDIVRI
ncbi:hypothetical protein DPMN_013581 [Dreissena polymorpha]|uniref:Uncharacterized protein n=1 Tax=Dreissena polymorpha TaxID=45954 RepID=A0A9D4N973_DREPO|nr:hypothetical protein DPMN_013528 [Dreissena polymorpha]KAH3889524.1 hypothetical protein DPMN_013581 [Dreissena polymorpha]